MKLATLNNGLPDGQLVVVSDDGARFIDATPVAATLQAAIEKWSEVAAGLQHLATQLADGGGDPIGETRFAAPLPRAWQWLDGSAFDSHGDLMQVVFNLPPNPKGRPLMYQGMSHQFLGPFDDVILPSETDGIDFEGEFGVITDFVPMGVSAEDAMAHIKLIVQINDWSLRAIAPVEMKTGFGWVQAKPACSVAPFAVTPDVLGSAWANGRVCLPLAVDWNGARFGNASGEAMSYGFHELIAHAAHSRSLCAGTVIGSGTVSNENFREVGSSCIAERRGIEIVDHGAAVTNFMSFGDTVRMEATMPDGTVLFGRINQQVIKA